MKYAVALAVLLLFISCDYFDVKKTSSDEILQEELQTFTWNDVDVYPSFEECEVVGTKLGKKQCFEKVLTSTISNYLANQDFVVSHDISDTLMLAFTISDQGKTTITSIKVKEETIMQLPDIESILHKSIDSLPEVFPAIKRGQQVTSQFKMPIVISVN